MKAFYRTVFAHVIAPELPIYSTFPVLTHLILLLFVTHYFQLSGRIKKVHK